jgi:hypothetical protein
VITNWLPQIGLGKSGPDDSIETSGEKTLFRRMSVVNKAVDFRNLT